MGTAPSPRGLTTNGSAAMGATMTTSAGAEAFRHLPVLATEVTELFAPVPAGLVIDATVGGGGHAAALLSSHPHLRVLGLDRDAAAVRAARERLRRFGDRAEVVRARFDEIAGLLDDRSDAALVGALFDLGVSSPQLDTADRGFSYRHDGPLDMRMDDRQTLDAATVVNTYPTEDLARLIAEYSDERYAGRVARAIERDRPITSTKRLAEVVRDAIPVPARREGGHPARRTFQAIRLEVNQELPVLTTALEAVLDRLLPGGRCVVLSYHSGEDRIAKDLFRSWSTPPRQPVGLPVEPEAPPARLVHRGVVVPSAEDQAANPRASSARLRALEMVTGRRGDR